MPAPWRWPWTRGPRIDQPPAPVHLQVAGGPDGRRADIGGERGILRCWLADHLAQDIADGSACARAAARQFVQARRALVVMREAVVEMMPVGLRPRAWEAALDGRPDVADDAEVELAAAAEISGRISTWAIFRIRRKKLLVGEIRAQHQQHVTGMHCGVAGRKADESRHADVIGIVVFDMVLAAERMDDRLLSVSASFISLSWAPAQPRPQNSVIRLALIQ